MGSEGMTYPTVATLQAERAMWQALQGQPATLVNSSNHYPQANGHMADSSDINSRSQMLGPYYNQPAFARQPSNAHNPAQRQVYRASEVSSLSSGFGDGDIIMPPPNIIYKPPIAQTIYTNTSHRPFSWMSRAGAGAEKRRDTVSTTTSDRPPHFRSINSWVDHQKERLRRVSSRAGAREDVPVMPAMPSQISQMSTSQQITYR